MVLQYNAQVTRIIGKCKAFPNGRTFGKLDKGKQFTVDDKAGKALLRFHFFEEVKPKREVKTVTNFQGGLE